MKKVKIVLSYLALVAVIFAWDKVSDWLIPIVRHSAVFNGLAVFTGLATIPIWLVLTALPDQRPFPPDARLPRLLLKLEFFSLSAGITLWGLSYWFPVLEPAAIVLGAVFVISAGILIVLILRADKKQAANKQTVL